MPHPDRANERSRRYKRKHAKGSRKVMDHAEQIEAWAYRMQTATEMATVILTPGGRLAKAAEIAIIALTRGF